MNAKILYTADKVVQRFGLDKLVDHVIPRIVANAAGHEVWAKGPIKPQGVTCGYDRQGNCNDCRAPGGNQWGRPTYHCQTDSGNCDWGWPFCSGCRGGSCPTYTCYYPC